MSTVAEPNASRSCWQVTQEYLVDYGPAALGMVVVAAIVYTIWGEFALLYLAAASGAAYYFREQIRWFIFADSWWPVMRNAVILPFASYVGGLPGTLAAMCIGVITTMREQWQLYTHRHSLQEVNVNLRDENTQLRAQIAQLQAQNEEVGNFAHRIEQICPELAQWSTAIDQQAGRVEEVRLQILDDRARQQQVVDRFIAYYQRVVSDPNIADRISAANRLEMRITALITQLEARNQQIAQQMQESSSIALRQLAVEQLCQAQVAALQDIIQTYRRE